MGMQHVVSFVVSER